MTFQEKFENLSKEDSQLVGKVLWAAFTAEGMRTLGGTSDFNEAVCYSLWSELTQLARQLASRLTEVQS